MWSDEQLAGWLEGEGSFFLSHDSDTRHRAHLSAVTTDFDVAVQAAQALGAGAITGPRIDRRGPNRKPSWMIRLTGKQALTVMLRIYTFLGERRRAAVQSVLDWWEHEPICFYSAVPRVNRSRRGIASVSPESK